MGGIISRSFSLNGFLQWNTLRLCFRVKDVAHDDIRVVLVALLMSATTLRKIRLALLIVIRWSTGHDGR